MSGRQDKLVGMNFLSPLIPNLYVEESFPSSSLEYTAFKKQSQEEFCDQPERFSVGGCALKQLQTIFDCSELRKGAASAETLYGIFQLMKKYYCWLPG